MPTKVDSLVLPADHVLVKVRAIGHECISKGERDYVKSCDKTFAQGDVFSIHVDIARALEARQFVDIVESDNT